MVLRQRFLLFKLLVCLLCCLGIARFYSGLKQPDEMIISSKIEFDLDQLDADGLRGPPDGKVALSYEFAIPDNQECKTLVGAIDKTVQFMPDSRGRTVKGDNECLCIGSTHQKDFRQVLYSLAELSYIERIIICDFE